jgi:cell division protein FtsI/penicillin-binding protein 2
MRSRPDSDQTVKKASLLGLAACGTIALTAWAAGAQESPEQHVEQARRTAERAAATESALAKIEQPEEAPEASAEPTAGMEPTALSALGRGFAPANVSPLPEDWTEAGLDLQKAERQGDRLVQTLPNGLKVEFTVDPTVQSHMEDVLDDYSVPHGGVALVEPDTGRVLALVSHTQKSPKMPDLARKAAAPSASTFKIVTAAALLETAGVNPEAETCYHGGTSHLTKNNIKGDPDRDHRCKDLGDALAWSINSIIAKLAYKHLDREDLQTWAKRFGYNTDIPFELEIEQSTAEIVEDPFEQARTAAGFWHTYLSPLHGALMSAAVENGGLMMRPSIIEKVTTPEGKVLKSFDKKVLRRVMSEETAETLAKLLQRTTDKGTARKYFGYRGAFPNDVTSGGKTGTLANHDPYLSFTWFVGYGRHNYADGLEAAVGGLICNTPKWRIKGPWAASETLRKYFQVAEQRDEKEIAKN